MIGLSGVIGTNILKKLPKFHKETGILYEKIERNNLFIERRTLMKFLDDKIFLETSIFLIAIEGVIFNKVDLLDEYNIKVWSDCIIKMYEEKGETFFNQFRGSFSGFFYDKRVDTTIIFTDHIGDKPIYFYKEKEEFVFSSSIKFILKIFIANDIKYNLDTQAAYSLLTHGYMLENLTPFKGVKRLKAGCYIRIINNKYEVKRFHIFSNSPNYKLSEIKIIDKIDFLFKRAVKRQWQKNKEYNFTNFAPLSAGLDSRISTWALSEIDNNIVNITYSQSDYLDETIPKEISAELKTHLLFKTLDNGLSLFFLDEMVKRNCGVVLYGGPAQVWDTFKLLDKDKMGVVSTGMLGDVVVGASYRSLEKEKEFSIQDGAYSTFLIDKFRKVMTDYKIENYKNQEIFNFYNRGFNGANMGAPLVFQEFTESYSPFYDIEFLEFCLTIPVDIKWNYSLYDRWVIEKYPEAAKYAHNGRKISRTKGRNYKLFGKTFTIRQLGKKIIDIFTMKTNSMETSNHMNPFDYWYKTNIELKNYMDDYYQKNIKLIKDNELKHDLVEMYSKGNTMEKTQVLTLLSIVQNYFYNTDWLNN